MCWRTQAGRQAAGRRALARGVHRRDDPHGGVSAGGRAARRPHPGARRTSPGRRPPTRTARSSRPEELKTIYEGEGHHAGQGRDRLLPDRRAVEPHLVRAAPTCSATRTSATTTAHGPSGAAWSASRSRRTSRTSEMVRAHCTGDTGSQEYIDSWTTTRTHATRPHGGCRCSTRAAATRAAAT